MDNTKHVDLETKVLEIRDSRTYIGVLAIRMESDNPAQSYHLRRVGHGHDSITVMRINDQLATNDVYEWSRITPGTRTMPAAHDYIEKHFDQLEDGDVVDVQFILGETKTRKTSEAVTCPL